MAKLVIQGWQNGHVATAGWQGPLFANGEPSIMEFENDGIQVAVIISLFCDRRLTFDIDDELTPNDRRGWWGDDTLEAGDRIGSFLWRLLKDKMIDEETFPKTERFIRQALQWMLDDGVIKRIDIELRKEDNDIGRARIQLFQPDKPESTNFFFTWNLYKQEIGVVV